MPAGYPDLIRKELEKLELQLPDEETNALARYCSELDRWNRKINLTGLRGADLVRRLVAEPVWIAKQLEFSGVLADIGSGNGSPAIPIRVVSRLTTTHLVEARARRAAFLRHLVADLKLNQVIVHRDRFDKAAGTIEAVDWITLQAVALTQELLDSMKAIARSTAQVVWITSRVVPPIDPVRHLNVPGTATEVLVFRLDLS